MKPQRLAGTEVSGGRWAELWPMPFNFQILVLPCRGSMTVDRRYSYTDLVEALVGFATWAAGDDDEPAGWIRSQPDNRRRPDGDAAREYVRP